MKKYLRPLGVALILALLTAGIYAASSEDSLVSLSYLRAAFFPKAEQAGREAADRILQSTYDAARGQLDAAAGGAAGTGAPAGSGGLYSQTLERRGWTSGQTITLSTGSVFLMLEGSAGVAHTGAVIDVTDGTEVASGSQLAVNHRYVVGEDTSASVTIYSGRAALGIQGSYAATAGDPTPFPFVDVSGGDWFYEPVKYVYERGLFSGVGNDQFAPRASMSRAMLMTVLHRQAGSPAAASGSQFSDVPEGEWYAEAIRWGAWQGIASGVGDNRFDPNGQVTREQTVVMMYNFASRYMGLNMDASADLSAFADGDRVSGWAQQAMVWAVSRGIISGSGSGGQVLLEPQRSTNRAEMATMLRSFCEKIL